MNRLEDQIVVCSSAAIVSAALRDPRVSTSDDSDLSIEFRHIFLKLVG